MRTAFPLSIAAGCACALVVPAAAAQPASSLRDWALARCLTRAYGLDTAAGKDAADSAAALLERGAFGPKAIDAVEGAIGRRLARRATGSTGGTYATLQCIELDRDAAFARTVRSLDRAR